MKAFPIACLLVAFSTLGCSPDNHTARSFESQRTDFDLNDPWKGLGSYNPKDDLEALEHLQSGETSRPQVVLPTGSPAKPAVTPFLVEGTFVPSGWMGDSENPSGPLKHEVGRAAAYSAPTCDKWTYLPPAGGEQRWIAVAYQGPTANNWGAEKGVDFSGKGYTKLTFMARGEEGSERLLVKSGGCTSPGAQHPATYEATIGTIVLDSSWKQFEIPLDDCDLSNTCSVFSFTINRAMAPEGCTFYIDDIALHGPENY